MTSIVTYYCVTGLEGDGPYWYVHHWENELGLRGYIHNDDCALDPPCPAGPLLGDSKRDRIVGHNKAGCACPHQTKFARCLVCEFTRFATLGLLHGEPAAEQ